MQFINFAIFQHFNISNFNFLMMLHQFKFSDWRAHYSQVASQEDVVDLASVTGLHVPQQAPLPEAEQGHGPGLLEPGPCHGDHEAVEVEAVDLAALQGHDIEHQLGSRAVKSKNKILKIKNSCCHNDTLTLINLGGHR